jgi:hypothetical protein
MHMSSLQRTSRWASMAFLLIALCAGQSLPAQTIRVGTFDVDATPQVGSPLAYDPMKEATGRLSCRGLVLTGSGKPIVICAVDWLGVANAANEQFRRTLADAVGTSMERVVMHALHQHDAPRCDLTAAEILPSMARQRLILTFHLLKM